LQGGEGGAAPHLASCWGLAAPKPLALWKDWGKLRTAPIFRRKGAVPPFSPTVSARGLCPRAPGGRAAPPPRPLSLCRQRKGEESGLRRGSLCSLSLRTLSQFLPCLRLQIKGMGGVCGDIVGRSVKGRVSGDNWCSLMNEGFVGDIGRPKALTDRE